MQASGAILTLTVDEMVRSISVSKNLPYAIFLGAGASISSQVPSASDCIWDWKRQIFLSQHPGLESQFENISLPSVRQRIQQWLDDEGTYPPNGSEEEYGFYIEKCYPLAEHRRHYFENILKNARPHIGYKLLALLAMEGVIRSAWTTNFDGLVAKASAMVGVNYIEIGLDSVGRLDLPNRSDELRIVSLHGDYRYDALKNTPDELKMQDEKMREALIKELRDVNLIVIGYSGRDKSVMDTLEQAYSFKGSGRLYWCGNGDDEPPPVVRQLLQTALSHNRQAFYIATDGFDDLMVRLASACLTGKRREYLSTLHKEIDVKPPAFSVTRKRLVGCGKTNALPCRFPKNLFSSQLNYHVKDAWRGIREATKGTEVIAVPYKRRVFWIGDPESAQSILAEFISGPVTQVDTYSVLHSTTIQSLLMHGLVRALSQKYSLGYNSKGLIWELEPSHITNVRGKQCRVYRAACLYFRWFAEQCYLVIKPTVRGSSLDGTPLDAMTKMELTRQELSGQYNRDFNEALNYWIDKLFPIGLKSIEYPFGKTYSFSYQIRRVPAFIALYSTSLRRPEIALPNKIERLVSLHGEHVDEPSLLFSDSTGRMELRDIFPLRGILRNRPFDYALTTSGLATDVRLGIVSPAKDVRKLHRYLQSLNNFKAAEKSDEYWLDYPGFAHCFGVPLHIPEPESGGWKICPEPDGTADVRLGALELLRNIETCIESIYSATTPNLILIFIPARWRRWERLDLPDRRFDLHDFIKAFCVRRGIASQLLRESTITARFRSRIAWGLALQFYVKSMRTPWTLERLDNDTVFVGLGYSVDSVRVCTGNHIVLGCSHIYGSNGLGLQYKLTRIENPIMRQGNPHMRYEDARRTAEKVRQLFFESLRRLPNRVVFHKNTPFLDDERKGLLDGLDGVENVEMIEVVVEKAVRTIASALKNGSLGPDDYPVRRGTMVVLGDNRALVWVHGSTESIHPQRRYYLGKRRIPAPLLVTRHHGMSSLRTITRELLGLSKMDWNSFDMYNKMPATIQSSQIIARIGALLDGLQPPAYDYRLFI